MLQELQTFGLSEKEAKVYLASLELGRATADQLAKHAKVNRSTTYVQIEALSEMGLMSTHEEGKKTYFMPESPDHLKRIFDRKRVELAAQEKELAVVIPNLQHLFESAGERPIVRFFEGKEGLVTMRKEILKSKSKRMYVAVSHDDYVKVFPAEKERAELSNMRVAKKIRTKVLYTKTDEEFDPSPYMEMIRIPADQFPFESDMYIYDNTVALASLKGRVVGVIIESAAIKQSLLSIFNLAWEAAKGHELPKPKSNDRKK